MLEIRGLKCAVITYCKLLRGYYDICDNGCHLFKIDIVIRGYVYKLG